MGRIKFRVTEIVANIIVFLLYVLILPLVIVGEIACPSYQKQLHNKNGNPSGDISRDSNDIRVNSQWGRYWAAGRCGIAGGRNS